jgi:hypothetical protein
VPTPNEQLVRQALEKRRTGRKPSREEASALRAWERLAEEQARRKHYSSIPKKHWLQLSGRTYKTLADHAARFGIPVGGPDIDLGKVARWIHDFLAEQAARKIEDEEEFAGPDSPALERLRQLKGDLAELQLQERRRELLPRFEVHQMLGALAARLRDAMEKIDRRGGAEFTDCILQALNGFKQELDTLCGGAADQGDNEGAASDPGAGAGGDAGRAPGCV